MKVDRILDLADMVENDRLELVRFNMRHLADKDSSREEECGTVACLAGYVLCAAYGNIKAKQMVRDFCYTSGGLPPSERAAKILGLNDHQKRALFYPPGYQGTRTFTREQAADTLRRFAETGEVVWRA